MRKSNSLHSVFLGYLLKKGKKVKANKILENTFVEVYKKTNLPLNYIFKKVLSKIGNVIELKTIKVRKNTYIVPFSIKSNRRNYVVVKKIMSTINEDKSKMPFHLKLSNEIINILADKPSKTLAKNKEAVKQSITNRSNIHYRW